MKLYGRENGWIRSSDKYIGCASATSRASQNSEGQHILVALFRQRGQTRPKLLGRRKSASGLLLSESHSSQEDLDDDGDTDLVLHFRLLNSSLDCDSTEGTLLGETFDGKAIEGPDSVRMVGETTAITVGQPIP